MERARIGFVGCGTHSSNNLYPMLRYARAELVAVCDLDEDLARRNAEIFGGKAWYASVDEMLDAAELDGVMVVGAPELHYEAGMKALRRKIPTFVEKPTAPDLERAREMTETARANGVFVMTGFMKRHGLTYGKIRQYVDEGRFIPNSCFMKYMHWPMNAQSLRDMLLGMSSHPVDLVMSFLGKPKRMQCSQGVGANDFLTLAVNMSFDDGRVGQLLLGSQARIQERMEISGVLDDQPAFFVADNVMGLELHRQGRNGVDVLAPSLDRIRPDFDLEDIRVWRPDYGIPNMGQTRHFVQGFAGEVREFCDAVLEKRTPVPSMDEALDVMEVIEAICRRPDGVTEM